MAQAFLTLLIFILGASVGSFLSVVIYRIQKNKKGILFGHSFCPKCKTRLKSTDLIPIVSFVISKGKCKYCKTKISTFYPLLELTTGITFLALYTKFQFIEELQPGIFEINSPSIISFIFYALYGSLLIATFFYDLQTKKIPNMFLYSLIGLSIIGSIIIQEHTLASILIAVLINTIFYGGQIAISKGKWLGEGDVYLTTSLAIIFGWKLFIVSTVLTYFAGTMIALPLLLTKKTNKQTEIPFAPFIIIGAFITIFFGNDIASWYAQTLLI